MLLIECASDVSNFLSCIACCQRQLVPVKEASQHEFDLCFVPVGIQLQLSFFIEDMAFPLNGIDWFEVQLLLYID